MEEIRQDVVLHIIYLLTRFLPAVRAAYILIRVAYSLLLAQISN
jgi:hypothetical protein